MIVYNPWHNNNRKIKVKANMNPCPEHPFTSLGLCSSLGGISKRI